jgi:hypothetical protein
VQVRKDGDCEKLVPEIARNLPEIGPETDLRSLDEDEEYAGMWAALYWSDDRSDDRIRQYELGQFQEIADDARADDLPSGDWQYGKGWQE